jgi:hypothetical protein
MRLSALAALRRDREHTWWLIPSNHAVALCLSIIQLSCTLWWCGGLAPCDHRVTLYLAIMRLPFTFWSHGGLVSWDHAVALCLGILRFICTLWWCAGLNLIIQWPCTLWSCGVWAYGDLLPCTLWSCGSEHFLWTETKTLHSQSFFQRINAFWSLTLLKSLLLRGSEKTS